MNWHKLKKLPYCKFTLGLAIGLLAYEGAKHLTLQSPIVERTETAQAYNVPLPPFQLSKEIDSSEMAYDELMVRLANAK